MLGALLAAPAEAQERSAREEFVLGQRAADEHRWADALAHFQRAYASSSNPVALYDAATTLRLLGRYVEARDALATLLSSHPDLALDLREGALAMRADVEPRIARLVLALPELPGLAVRVDGALREVTLPEDTIELDPGEHALSAVAPGRAPFERTLELEPGGTARVSIELDEAPADRSIEHWIIGLVSGAAALAIVAVAIGVTVALEDAAQLAPRTDVVLSP